MKREWHSDEEGPLTHHARDATDGFAERHFFWSRDRDCLARQPILSERRCQHPRKILDRQWPHRLFSHANEAKDRERVKGVAEMVEHVIAAAVDHACLKDCVVQSGGADDFFGGPLRFVVGRAAIGTRAEEAEQHDFSDACAARGFHYTARGCNVNALVGLRADLAIDSSTVRHRASGGESAREFVGA